MAPALPFPPCSNGLAVALGQRLVVLRGLLSSTGPGSGGSGSTAPSVDFVSAVDAPESLTALAWLAAGGAQGAGGWAEGHAVGTMRGHGGCWSAGAPPPLLCCAMARWLPPAHCLPCVCLPALARARLPLVPRPQPTRDSPTVSRPPADECILAGTSSGFLQLHSPASGALLLRQQLHHTGAVSAAVRWSGSGSDPDDLSEDVTLCFVDAVVRLPAWEVWAAARWAAGRRGGGGWWGGGGSEGAAAAAPHRHQLSFSKFQLPKGAGGGPWGGVRMPRCQHGCVLVAAALPSWRTLRPPRLLASRAWRTPWSLPTSAPLPRALPAHHHTGPRSHAVCLGPPPSSLHSALTGRPEGPRLRFLTAGTGPPLAAYEGEEAASQGLLSLVSDLASSTASSLLGAARSYVPGPAAAAGRTLLRGLRRSGSRGALAASSSAPDLGQLGQQAGGGRPKGKERIPGEPASLAAAVWDEKRSILQMALSPWWVLGRLLACLGPACLTAACMPACQRCAADTALGPAV